MSFHRYEQPSYPGFPSLAAPPGGVSFNGTTYDLFNVIDSGAGASGSAFADDYKTTGPNAGTYMHAFGEDATSSNFNRGMKALAQNCDFLDDLLNRALSVPVRTSLVTAASPVASIVLPIATFVGDSGSYPIEMLFNVVDDQDRAIITGGTRVQVASITGAAIGDGFSTGSVTLVLNVSIPTSTQYRVFYGTRSKLATLPTDAFTFDRTYGLYADIIPYAGSSNWKDGNPLSATNVEQALDEIVSDLADSTNDSSGARRIGYNGTGSLWAGGGTLAATSVEQAIDEVVATLGTTTNGSSGASKVGYSGSSSLWKDATTLAAGQVEAALDEIVTTLAGVASGTGQGVSKIGLYATNFSGALTALGGGGILTTDTSLADALSTVNAKLTARRAYTAVFTDNVYSQGGDYNGTNTLNAIRNGVAWESGTFFVRRGVYFMDTAITDFKISGDVVGEGWFDATPGPVVLFTDLESNSSDITLAARLGNTSVPPSFTRLYFGVSNSNVTKRYILGQQGAEAPIQFNRCGFQVGQTEIRDGARLRDCAIEQDSNSTNNESIYITASKDVVLDGIKCALNSSSAAGGVANSAIIRMTGGLNTGTTHKFPISIRNSYFATAGGRVLVISSSSAEIVYENCVFHGTGVGAEYVAYLSAAENVTFRRCIFIQDAPGKVCLSVNNCGNVLFEDCVVWGTAGSGDVRDIEVLGETTGRKSRSVRFVNTTLRVRQSVVSYTQHKWYVDATAYCTLSNCELVLDFASASHGPLMLLQCSVDGLRVDMAGKTYYGDNSSSPFEFRLENPQNLTSSHTTYSRVQISNIRPPATAVGDSLILVLGATLLNPNLSYDTTATPGATTFTYGVVSVSGRVVGGHISLGGYLAWGRVFYQQLQSSVQGVELDLTMDAATLKAGCISYFSDDSCQFHNNIVSLVPETAGLGTTKHAFEIIAGQDRLSMLGNFVDINGTTNAAYLKLVQLNDSDNMIISNNTFRFSTGTAGIAAIEGLGAPAGSLRGLIKDNLFLNRGSVACFIDPDTGVTSTPNVYNVNS